ncbi:MAG: 23S rRNA (adenine(2503)-C(2))-methyltransferase RlmN [Bacteroidales bacterium]|nr:23S rRNA (adenine(2503)-C(2))-methyltransferase RlmN [Bacteroidales bacterium]
MISKTNLLGMTLAQLQQLCAAEDMPKYTAKQMCDWLYAKRVDSVDAMTNLSLKARSRLNEIAYIGRHAPVQCQVSTDGTKKYLFEIEDEDREMHVSSPNSDNSQFKRYVEAVYIPDGDRATLCISCQVGCRMGCRFCVTGQQGFHGNLTAADILNQIFSIPEFTTLTNVVYMGMGEPMDNLDSVLGSTEVLTADWGLGWSPKRITVSSVGIIPGLRRFLKESQCHLAVSLHNPFAQERLAIMPMQKAYPIAEVVALLKQYDWSGQRRVSFEYTMFAGLNDDLRHATELVSMLKGLYCRVNLIRFHASPDTPYRTASSQAMNQFRDYLNAHGITCTIRASRGEDIMAACGLLAGQACQ